MSAKQFEVPYSDDPEAGMGAFCDAPGPFLASEHPDEPHDDGEPVWCDRDMSHEGEHRHTAQSGKIQVRWFGDYAPRWKRSHWAGDDE